MISARRLSCAAFLVTLLAAWGGDAVWSSNIVWSDRVIGQHDGDNIIWGTVAPAGSRV